MIIGLHDAERDHMKGKTFPNYALMKISAYHKNRGDKVEWWEWNRNPPAVNNQITISGKTAIEEFAHELSEYNSAFDVVYSSKVFDFTPENPYLPENTIKGGTGYDAKSMLKPEIEECFPDYSIYPECDYAIGYITRGCPNKCRWCVVPEKEGNIKPYRRWDELIRKDTDKLILMDNNILSCEYGLGQLEGLIDSGYSIDLNQGMDARLVDERAAEIISKIKWIRFIRFSCDQIPQIPAIMNAAALLGERGIKPYRLFVYLLVTKDLENAEYRVNQLRQLKNLSIYAQAERNERMGIVPNKAQLEFQQRYIYGRAYKNETWTQYCSKRGLKF